MILRVIKMRMPRDNGTNRKRIVIFLILKLIILFSQFNIRKKLGSYDFTKIDRNC